MKKILLGLVGALVLLSAVLLVRVAAFRAPEFSHEPFDPVAFDHEQATDNLAAALRYKTISHQIPWEFRGTEFTRFHEFLAETYPRVHETLARETAARYSLLYTWEGSNPDLAPIILMAHFDVVPVDAGSEMEWTYPAFEGTIADGYVWGRGAIDNKSGVMAILEAAEALLAEGFAPERTVYFCFGHDEELGGFDGAATMAATLEERGVRAWFSLDEGSAVADGILPGLDTPIILISVAEKGYVSIELKATGPGGHSSNPPPQTTVGIVAAAIARLEENQRPARISGPVRMMFDHAGPHMAFPFRLVLANQWLFGPVLRRQLEAMPTTNAAIRTTTAATIMEAGTKENVLPIQSRAVVNFRIIPGETTADVLAHVERVVNDPRIEIAVIGDRDPMEPSPVSDVESDSYALIARSLRQVFPDYPLAPSMTLGGTDSKHYYGVAENLYRVQPLVLTDEDLGTIHGTDEKLGIDNYLRSITAYAQILRNAAG